MKKILMFVGILALVGCASKPVQVVEKEPALPEFQDETGEVIDLPGLKAHLKMDRPNEDLGYAEKSFFTCKVGYGFSGTERCRPRYLMILNFRIQCRDSEGTVSSVTNEELIGVKTDNMHWSVGDFEGNISTDGEGFGQVVALTSTSMKQKKVRLTHNNDFLLMTAKEMRRIIVPRPWCQREFGARGVANSP